MNIKKTLLPIIIVANTIVLSVGIYLLLGHNHSFSQDPTPELRPTILYSPWRDAYEGSSTAHTKRKLSCDCVFCHMYATPSEDDFYLVIHRFKHCFVILNKYPYTLGHVLIVTRNHHGHYLDLPREAHYEIADVLTLTLRALNTVMKPDGVNTGYNIGRDAGASIPGHLHLHIVPRWRGYSNSIEQLSNTRVIARDMERIYKKFNEAFHRELDASPIGES